MTVRCTDRIWSGLTSRGSRAALAALAALLTFWLMPSLAHAATVTIGPSSITASNSGGCQTTDCARFTSSTPAGMVGKAPADGVITTWRVGEFVGKAKLIVVKDAGGGAFTIVRSSPAESEPCAGSFCSGAAYTFTLNPGLPISKGEFIGVEMIQSASCNSASDPCTFVGEVNCVQTGAEFQYWNNTPAVGSPSTPTGNQNCVLNLNADEVTTTKTVAVSLSQPTITADGRATTIATATVADGSTPVTGATVAFASSDGSQKVGAVTDNGDGTYTATITSSETVGKATVTATDNSDPAQPSGSAELTQEAPTVDVSVAPASITADGKSTATATVTLTGVQDEPVPGQAVSITTKGPAFAGLVRDNGNGTYTTAITASHTPGKVTVTGTDISVAPNVSAQDQLVTKAPGSPGKKKPCVVPKLAGDTLAAAKRALTKASCTLGKVTTKKSKKVRSGHVISSKPKAGSKVTGGKGVGVTLSAGPH